MQGCPAYLLEAGVTLVPSWVERWPLLATCKQATVTASPPELSPLKGAQVQHAWCGQYLQR